MIAIAPFVAPLLATFAVLPAPMSSAMEVDVGLARPVMLAGRKNVAHLRVSLIGQRVPSAAERAPVNVCLAIDRSGSMQGEKIVHARQGAVAALRRLGPADLVSVVAYDDVVQVIVPATKASDHAAVEAGIRRLQSGGSTALFAGVVKCAAELRKFGTRDRVSRIILLSDGIANVGPSSPSELGALGAQLGAEGISVTTVGLGTGYNEDLMSALAMSSDGGHVFVERAEELGRFLDEQLATVTAVVARDVDVRIRCGNGVRPLRVLGRPADIVGGTVTAPFGKIYARRQHYFVLELEVDPGASGSERRLADVDVSYRDLLSQRDGKAARVVSTRFAARPAEVEAGANQAILAELGLIEDNRANEEALLLLQKGQGEAAQERLRRNADSLEQQYRSNKDVRLKERVERSRRQADEVLKAPAPAIKQMRQKVSDDPLGGLKL